MSISKIMSGLQNAAADIQAEKNRRAGGRAALSATNVNLGNLPTKYGTLASDIAAFLAANPADPYALLAQAQWNKLVAEFNADKAAALADVQALGI